MGRFFFSERGNVIDEWNNLQQCIINSKSINCFKNGPECTQATQMDFCKLTD